MLGITLLLKLGLIHTLMPLLDLTHSHISLATSKPLLMVDFFLALPPTTLPIVPPSCRRNKYQIIIIRWHNTKQCLKISAHGIEVYSHHMGTVFATNNWEVKSKHKTHTIHVFKEMSPKCTQKRKYLSTNISWFLSLHHRLLHLRQETNLRFINTRHSWALLSNLWSKPRPTLILKYCNGTNL